MHAIRHKIIRAARQTRDRGASAVEYGLMVAAIAALIVAIVFGLGHLIGDTFKMTCQSIATGSGPDNAQPIPDACKPATVVQPAPATSS